MRLSATWRHPSSVIIVAIVINAALYAAGSYTTAYIPSPWGVGQFRPAVVIPALFSVVFGPWAGGVGAALGTLIADSLKHGAIYPGSLFASVPGNFVGFFLMGCLFKKKFNWTRIQAKKYTDRRIRENSLFCGCSRINDKDAMSVVFPEPFVPNRT